MDNPEEVLQSLDEFAKLKPKSIPRELEDYLMYVARTGDPVYQWPTVKILFREKLLNVITEFYETTPTLDVAPSPNVDPFNYETMKSVLLERLEAFSNAPFTVQRLCELLTTPRKEYNRPDKFMRAIEKNILVVSTREPGGACRPDSALSEPIPNGVSASEPAEPAEPLESAEPLEPVEPSEPAEPTSNQSSSSTSEVNNEENGAQTSSEACPKELEENDESRMLAESSSEAESNHIETEKLEASDKGSDEAEVSKGEASESDVKEASDSSDSVTFGEVNSVGEVSEAVYVSSTDSVSNSEVSDLPEQSSVCEAETSTVESVPMSSTSEISSVGDEVLQSVEDIVSSEAVKEDTERVSESNNEGKESDNVECDAPENEDQVTSDTVSEAAPEPSVSAEETSKPVESTESDIQNEEPSNIESAVSSPLLDQPADSTASDATTDAASDAVEDKELPTSGSQEVSGSKSDKDIELDDLGILAAAGISADILESSEAASVAVKGESQVKESVEAEKDVKGDVDASITSTGMEAMDVDESSNQPSGSAAVASKDSVTSASADSASSASADSEAMEVAVDEDEEDEAMDVSDDSALEEMTTSPQESGQ